MNPDPQDLIAELRALRAEVAALSKHLGVGPSVSSEGPGKGLSYEEFAAGRDGDHHVVTSVSQGRSWRAKKSSQSAPKSPRKGGS